MKIAIVVWELNVKGGAQRQALELSNSLQDNGHDVHVYTYCYDKDKCYEDLCANLKIYSVYGKEGPMNDHALVNGILAKARGVINMMFDLKAMKKIRDLMIMDGSLSDFDVINLHDDQVFKLASVIKHGNIVWMMNDMIGIQPYYKKDEGKFLVNLYYFLLLITTKWRISKINKIVVLDNWNKKRCKKYYHKDATVIRSGINPSLFNSIKVEKERKGKGVDIFANGIMLPYRRFEDLVLAARYLRDWGVEDFKIKINGASFLCPEYFDYIEGLITRNRLDEHITVTNGMSEKVLLKSYTDADIFVFPNHEQTWGLAVFEAMLAGCACIVSKTAGASEVLSDGKNALLVDPKSPDQIANNLKELIYNKKIRDKLSTNAKEYVSKNLSWKKYSSNMLQCFKQTQ